jgi:hypothetical protein
LPYFDVFLRERVLASIVTSPALRYDSLYDTRVYSEPAGALDVLETIWRSPNHHDCGSEEQGTVSTQAHPAIAC